MVRSFARLRPGDMREARMTGMKKFELEGEAIAGRKS